MGDNMNNSRLELLRDTINKVAERFSNPDREKNSNKETFIPVDYKILSESVATVTMQKLPTHKLCLFLFYFLNTGGGYWVYFVPTDSHLLGLANKSIIDSYVKIENYNKEKIMEK